MDGGADMRAIVLWDLDRTLVDLQVDIEDVRRWKVELAARFEPRGWAGGWSPMLPSLEGALSTVGASDQERRTTYDDLDRWEFEALAGVDVHDEMLRVVCALSRAQVPQALITNNGVRACKVGIEALRARAERLAWPSPCFGAVVTRSADVRSKPNADMFERAIDAADRPPAQPFAGAVVIGDSPGDFEAAGALGRVRTIEVLAIRAEKGRLVMAETVRAELHRWGLTDLATSFQTIDPSLRTS